MTAQLRSALRAVVLPSPDAYPQDTPTRRLLNELGHDVTRADSPRHAMDLMRSERTDLLVIDITNNSQNRDLVSTLDQLPESAQPAEVAVFSDSIDAQLRDLRRRSFPKMHIFLKPLHMHGLLSVLRQIERQQNDKGISA